jgi:superfamily II DNA or RNA helicase
MLPFTHKILMDWAGPQVFRDGKTSFENGSVQQAEYEPPFVRGTLLRAGRPMISQFELLAGGAIENQCPCRDSVERGIVCAHVVALGLELLRRQTDPERERKAREEQRRAARLEHIDESRYLKRVPADQPGAIPARIVLTLRTGWSESGRAGKYPVRCAAEYSNQRAPLDRISTRLPLSFSAQDESILFVLEDISEGPARGELEISPADFINLLNLCAGKEIEREEGGPPIRVNAAKMNSVLRLDLDRENGELILFVHTELPFMDAQRFPLYILAGRAGWIYDAENFWPLAGLLPAPLQSIYDKPVCVQRDSVLRFLREEVPLLEKHIPVQTDISIELFSIEPAEPAFHLAVRGSPASLSAVLYADYDGLALVAGKPDPTGLFARPDPADILRYTIRNPARESAALQRLAAHGFAGERGDELTPIVGTREVLNFLGGHLPALRRLGWKVTLEGRVEPFLESASFATPVVRVRDGEGGNWFDVRFDFEDGLGQSLSEAEIQRALLKGEAYLERGGRTILLDSDAIQTARAVFNDCRSREGTGAGAFRLDRVYAGYVKTSLDALDGVDVEAPPEWRARAAVQGRGQAIENVALDPAWERVLRPYQKEGVAWLRFLEQNLFGGILADEMGLGKTIQTLAWLQLARAHPEAKGKPGLLVCPSSLVENWADEAARFAPALRVLTLSGAERHEKREALPASDLVVTSYALLRRDIEQYAGHEFSAVILDEAQHIKNRGSQNAAAAKRLKGQHRLVLTGTPIENSVSDLWSIMDFLMPGYLGEHEGFRQNYEAPIGRGGPDGEFAQTRLRRKLHPFLLRRLKREVAKDLPAKIERIATCHLTRDQQLVYQQLLESSRQQVQSLVSQKGFNRSRLEILKVLLRLRQVCCHLELLKLPDLRSEYPSAKLDLFFELLDEALDGGHRILVFSQFTRMLAILRRELDGRSLRYCYLDGATPNRLEIVKTFNAQREIPLFLISLKAGGSGLNLTGADMVMHYDPWWNPAVEDQATDRAHRIGQQRTVYSVKLITRDTVEEKVLALQKRKKSVIDATLAEDEQVMEKMTWDDIQDILGG